MSAGQPVAGGDTAVDPRDLRTAQRWRRTAHVLSAVVLAIVAIGVVSGYVPLNIQVT